MGLAKNLQRAGVIVRRTSLLNSGKADAPPSLYLMSSVGNPAMEAEPIPGMPSIHADLIGVDAYQQPKQPRTHVTGHSRHRSARLAPFFTATR